MKILHVLQSRYSLPPQKYGGTERVVWALGTSQQAAGHQVRYLWGRAKNLPSNALVAEKTLPIESQIDNWPDIVHFHRPYNGELHKPYICTEHGNAQRPTDYSQNTVFLSRKHAENHGADCYVYNGLDWSAYGAPNLGDPERYFTFLGKSTAAQKNLEGAIKVASEVCTELKVLGGNRFNLKRTPPIFWDRHVSFYGMVGGLKKNRLIRNASALIFPIRWHEPFGLALIESLYLGVPVIATPFGSLPEIVDDERLGFLADSYTGLVEAAGKVSQCDRQACHQVAKERFCSDNMGRGYRLCYEKVLDGRPLNRQVPHSRGGLLDLLDIPQGRE